MKAPLVLTLLLGGFSSVACVKSRTVQPPAEITLAPITYRQWLDKLETLKGKIVVVDFWATWCAPCIERFPHMVRLYRTYRERGVTFVSMNLDDREDPQAIETARQFLVRQDARFANYRMDEVTPDAFEKLDLLGIPAVFVYDRNNRLRYRLTADDPNRQFSDEDVEKAIQDVLSQGAGS